MNANENNIAIIPFSEKLAAHFTRLNTAWLEKFFVVEPVDAEMLANPKQFFIDKGSLIFFATYNNDIAGTFALLKESDTVYELSKMAVDEKYQGKKIGNRMLEFAIAEAAAAHSTKIILYSSKKLANAIHLYRKYGFIEVPLDSSLYIRADIKMELQLQG